MRHPWSVLALGAVVLTLAVSGCAGSTEPASVGSGGGAEPPTTDAAAPGELRAQGTVLQVDGEPAMLCLGPIMESYPPQCDGPEITEWDWSSVEGVESASGVTWGSYAVQGTWDGTAFTPTQPPIMLALYDPIREVDPATQPENKGDASEEELLEVQERLGNDEFVEPLTSWPENGYLFVSVVYDDGSIQRYVDATYGADVVQVRSALRDVEG
ncbi:hypothetical protein CLV46_0924 [Diaminobutyricimonas aerilata]|uniref:Uncharacterized protein n=1 Tax=Diaminobutyricimonas aerilata TaxID=1162967 RepID=A0A2M9CHN5_9MICO|nr:hypothetical protein [Diaminobutyricimonas aerilata]PJJ71379.1 hypothetical protein CLV46_0924 [Diaminobutyricimonas aerilata]